MIYLDSSVLLAHLFDEEKRPDPDFWERPIQSSRLLEYEVWNRLNASRHADVGAEEVRRVLRRIELLDMTPDILSRALQPFPLPVRTLDGLHLATMEFIRGRGRPIELASFDTRLLAAAAALGIVAVVL